MVNKVTLIGNLGNDVELVTFDDGGKLAKFSLATSESYKNKSSGEKVTNTEWHNIVVGNPNQAEVAAKYLSKGDKIYLEGKIKYRSWEDSSGVKKYMTEIHVLSFSFLTTKGEKTDAVEGKPETKKSENSAADDDLPF